MRLGWRAKHTQQPKSSQFCFSSFVATPNFVMMGTAPVQFCRPTAEDDDAMINNKWTREDLNRHLLDLLMRHGDCTKETPLTRPCTAGMVIWTTEAATSTKPATIEGEEDDDVANDDITDAPQEEEEEEDRDDDSPRESSPPALSPPASPAWLTEKALSFLSNSSNPEWPSAAASAERKTTHFRFEGDVVVVTPATSRTIETLLLGTKQHHHIITRLGRSAGLCFVMLVLLAYVQIIPLVLFKTTTTTTPMPWSSRPAGQGVLEPIQNDRAGGTSNCEHSHHHDACNAEEGQPVKVDWLFRGRSYSRRKDAVTVVDANHGFHQESAQTFCERLLPDLSPTTVSWCAKHLLL
jgi:hypothetical protein